MSSNIKVQRICEYCGNEFTARTTVTKYCSGKCSKAAYKARKRDEKVKMSNTETKQIILQPIEQLKAKEFLTVREVAQLLNCSIRSAYYYIESGIISSVNLGQRLTRVKRSEIDKLFEQSKQNNKEQEQIQFTISDCYGISEVLAKFSISEKTLYEIVKRNNIPKIKLGRYAYIPKQILDKLLT